MLGDIICPYLFIQIKWWFLHFLGKFFKDYRLCALLINLLINFIRTRKLLTSVAGLRSSMASFTGWYYVTIIFCFETFQKWQHAHRERKSVFNYSIAILILVHSLQYLINPPNIYESYLQSRADKSKSIYLQNTKGKKHRIILLQCSLKP